MTSDGCWRSFAVFWLLSLVLLALVPLLSFAFGTSMDFGAIAERASAATGVPWTSSLFDLLRLCRAEPGLWLLLLGSFVPTLAALLVLAWGRDASQWRGFARRFRPVGEGRASVAHVSVYAVLCGVMLVGLLAVFELREMIHPGRYQQASFLSIQTLLTSLLFAALFDQGAVLEEGGWRGYATPLLHQGLIYALGIRGSLVVLDASSGAVVYEELLSLGHGDVMPSPVVSDGQIVMMGGSGEIAVIRAGRTFELTHSARLGEARATPTLIEGQIIIRDLERLWSLRAPR